MGIYDRFGPHANALREAVETTKSRLRGLVACSQPGLASARTKTRVEWNAAIAEAEQAATEAWNAYDAWESTVDKRPKVTDQCSSCKGWYYQGAWSTGGSGTPVTACPNCGAKT